MLSYLEAIGARARPLPTGAWTVGWPPTHVSRFGGSTTIAFDPLVADATKAELCVIGSDLLDRMLADATGRGFHCIARVDTTGEPPPEDVLASNLTFPNAKTTVEQVERGIVPYLLFNFRITLMTDEKRELLRSVMLNAETLRPHHVADVFLQESLTLPEEPVIGSSELEETYRAACRTLEEDLRAEVEGVRAKARSLLDEELRRIEAFYDTTIQELYAGRAQAPLEAEMTFRAEKDRRSDDARRKYALIVEVRLVNARTVLIPTTTMRVRVAGAKAAKDLGLEYDAVNLETNRPACESCGALVTTAYVCRNGHLACASCRRGCSVCDDVSCSMCPPGTLEACGTCVRPVCPDHAFLSEIDRKTYCPDHVHACAICGRVVGPPHVKACSLCAQSYCAVCVSLPANRCTTCTSLEEVPETHEDVVRLARADKTVKGIQRWLRARNGRYIVLLGVGAFFQYLFVLDATGAVVHRKKGRRLQARDTART